MKNTNALTVKRETEEYWGPVCQLPLKPAATSRPSDDFDVLADGAVVGTHLQDKRGASRLAVDVRWTSDIRKIARPSYAETREGAMAALRRADAGDF
jgi:hypothetical protein